MDKILRKLNLGTQVDRFDAEKIEPDNVISASHSELTRLGVSTIAVAIWPVTGHGFQNTENTKCPAVRYFQ